MGKIGERWWVLKYHKPGPHNQQLRRAAKELIPTGDCSVQRQKQQQLVRMCYYIQNKICKNGKAELNVASISFKSHILLCSSQTQSGFPGTYWLKRISQDEGLFKTIVDMYCKDSISYFKENYGHLLEHRGKENTQRPQDFGRKIFMNTDNERTQTKFLC